MDFNKINLKTPEGRNLMASLAMITTTTHKDKTPFETLDEIQVLADKMYIDSEPINPDLYLELSPTKLTKELLEEKGFIFESEDGGIFQQWKKPIDENVDLILGISPLQEIFVWIADEDAEDRDNEGVRVVLNIESIDLAIKCAEAIVGVETD